MYNIFKVVYRYQINIVVQTKYFEFKLLLVVLFVLFCICMFYVIYLCKLFFIIEQTILNIPLVLMTLFT